MSSTSARIGTLALMAVLASCDRSNLRPANLKGAVTCTMMDAASTSPLTVQIVLDSAAAFRPARMEILPYRSTPVQAGYLPNRLVAGFGAANGLIQECGGVATSVIRIHVTGQMASYPTWARAYSVEPVNWVIADDLGHALADSLHLAPGSPTVRVRWRTR
jgi:hypothetical protein